MRWSVLFKGLVSVFLVIGCSPVTGQDNGGLELPVQLIGFPVIILAVRLSNFVKRLTYALNPSTYRARSRRGTDLQVDDDYVADVEKRLIKEMGPEVCIYEDVCNYHALAGLKHQHITWDNLVRKYKHSPSGKKQYYMLSVFMGDILGSPDLCNKLATKGRSCGRWHST